MSKRPAPISRYSSISSKQYIDKDLPFLANVVNRLVNEYGFLKEAIASGLTLFVTVAIS